MYRDEIVDNNKLDYMAAVFKGHFLERPIHRNACLFCIRIILHTKLFEFPRSRHNFTYYIRHYNVTIGVCFRFVFKIILFSQFRYVVSFRSLFRWTNGVYMFIGWISATAISTHTASFVFSHFLTYGKHGYMSGSIISHYAGGRTIVLMPTKVSHSPTRLVSIAFSLLIYFQPVEEHAKGLHPVIFGSRSGRYRDN